MKKSMLIVMALMFASPVFAAGVCSQQEGSIIYDSATTFKNSVVIVNPRFLVAGKPTLIKGFLGAENTKYYGTAFCKAMGMKSGLVTDVQYIENEWVSEFDKDGSSVVGVGEPANSWGIKTVTCQK
jgi:hypothetical protein